MVTPNATTILCTIMTMYYNNLISGSENVSDATIKSGCVNLPLMGRVLCQHSTSFWNSFKNYKGITKESK